METRVPSPPAPADAAPMQRVLAWSVHAFTASGAVLGLLAVQAIHAGRFREALVWLFAAYLIDAVDGSLARAARVKEVLPSIDGRMLDYVIDFLNIVFIPAYFLLASSLLPEPLRLPAAGAVLLVSCYHYANLEAMTDDFYFRGFPAMWSIVVFYLFFLNLPHWGNGLVVAGFCILHFVPVKFIYPTRTVRLRRLNLALVALWAGCNLFLLYAFPEPVYPVLALSSGVMVYMAGFSVLATVQASKPEGRTASLQP
ncbi:phosphatidylcholine synthase [Roseibium sp.]|uniref:CDP-alcohol phosphatidyltransferase family protein n=1 Tax=Roseibium sp. TaxID=1936156 RepID=UPI0032665ED7